MKPATRAGCGLPTTYRADTRRVYIKRADGPSEQAFPLTTATQVAPGDTIRIGERFF
jgi:polysaccharide export outer membrane protein